jgi:hypothetical protein
LRSGRIDLWASDAGGVRVEVFLPIEKQ